MRKHFMFKVLLTLMVGLFSSIGVFAQQISVKGIVKDTAGDPIIGANVVVKGTTNGVITDFDGNFRLTVKQGDIIQISFIGYQTQELPASAQMNVILKEDTELLQEVVVIGYGVAKKNDLTGSVTAVKPDEMNKGLVANAQDMLAGKIAGVSVTNAGGTPGGGATIRIRGGSSLNASNDPLIVIDGLAMDNSGVKGLANPLSMVNPADIETFTVLKDASATAIYGSRGSNGVIIITTKKGKSGQKPQIAYNGNVSFGTKKKTIDVMNADEFRSFITNQYGEGSDAVNALGTANTNWQDEIYRMAVGTDHNITISGGLKNMPYRVSLGYTNQNGILKTSNFERYTASVNLAPSFFEDHLKVNVTAKGMIANNRYADTGAVNAAVWFDPTQSVRDSREQFKNFGGYYQWLSSGAALNDPNWAWNYNSLATKNPVALLDQKDDTANSKSFVGNIELDYKIHGFEDLRLHMNMGGDWSTGKQTTIVSPNSSTNTYYGYNGWNEEDKYNLSFNAYAQYYKDFNDAHHFDIMGGYEWQHFHRQGANDGFGRYQDTHAVNPGQEYSRNKSQWETENYLVSFFGRANYTLLDRYMLTATVRYDGSSRFKDHWALFPSFAFGWRMKEEAFLKDVDVLSDLKLRLGYGQTGQQEGIGDYNYFASYTMGHGNRFQYPLIGNAIYRPDAYNADLTWETTTTYNVGLDFGFMNGRLTGSVDAYYRETTDLLNTVYVAAGSNFRNQVTSNIGSLENKGVEASLNWKAISTNDLLWDLGFNVTYNKNEITELIGGDADYYVATGGISSGTGNTCQAHAVGSTANSYFVYQQVYDQNGLPIEGQFVDRNADGIVNEKDKYLYKSPHAPWTAGFTSKVVWKNWDFSFALRANFDNYVFNDLEAGASNMATLWAESGYLTNRPKNVIEKNWKTYDAILSDYFVQNASFLKMDNITLGYSFEQLFGTKISGRVYATASNVFTITDYKGIDPEVSYGIDNSLYPRPFTALLGVSLNF